VAEVKQRIGPSGAMPGEDGQFEHFPEMPKSGERRAWSRGEDKLYLSDAGAEERLEAFGIGYQVRKQSAKSMCLVASSMEWILV
jgi:hypothetical protein